MARMTWRTIWDDTAEHRMYVVEMALAVILQRFANMMAQPEQNINNTK